MFQVGFIGLGAMGSAMAWNIHNAGYPLAVYNRSPDKTRPFQATGVAAFTDPAELGRDADVVIIMVRDPIALHEVMERLGEGLSADTTVINMSTVSVEATRSAADKVHRRGARFVDAPVSGTVAPAQAGQLVILASGDRNDVEALLPLFKVLGKEVIYCGETGQGTHLKLVLNLFLGGMMTLLAEAAVLGDRLGLAMPLLRKALAAGPMNAPLFQAKGEAIEHEDYAKQFPVDLMFKDLNLILDAAGASAVPLPTTAAVRELYNAARAQGQGQADMAAVVRAVAALAGHRPPG